MLDAKQILLTMATGASTTTQVNIESRKNMMLYIPSVSTSFNASSIEVSLQGSYTSAATAIDVNMYDYPNAQVLTAKITAGTAGFYELPFVGAFPSIKLAVNTATTNAITLRLVYSD